MREVVVSSCPAPASGQATDPHSYPVVVLAEDDPVMRRTLSDFLAGEGFLVKEAADLPALRDVLREKAPSALVLDVHLGEHTVGAVLGTNRGKFRLATRPQPSGRERWTAV